MLLVKSDLKSNVYAIGLSFILKLYNNKNELNVHLLFTRYKYAQKN